MMLKFLTLAIPKIKLPVRLASGLNQSAQIHSQKLNKSLTLIKSDEDDVNGQKPMVLLLSWLMSKDKHLEKYEKIYLSQGFHVLRVRLKIRELLFPSLGSHIVSRQTVEWLAEHEEYTDITIHGFSVGGYLFGEILKTIKLNPIFDQKIRNRVRAQIFDSIVAMDFMATSLPRALTNNPILVVLIEFLTRAHMTILKSISVKHYRRSYQYFCDSNFVVPSLFFMSKADKLGMYTEMLIVVDKWVQRGMCVGTRIYEDSPHCGHLQYYPEDYLNATAELLEKVGLLKDRKKLPIDF